MIGPQHTDAASCPLGPSCPRARLLANLGWVAQYAGRLRSGWDDGLLFHLGYIAAEAATLASALHAARDTDGGTCGGGHE